MDLPVDLLMFLYTDMLDRVPTWYYYLYWALSKEHKPSGWALFTFSIHSTDFWEYFRYQSNGWTTIYEQYEFLLMIVLIWAAIVGHKNGGLVLTDNGLYPWLKLTQNYSHRICGNFAVVSWMQYIYGRALLIPQIPTARIHIVVECVGLSHYIGCCIFCIFTPSWNQL